MKVDWKLCVPVLGVFITGCPGIMPPPRTEPLTQATWTPAPGGTIVDSCVTYPAQIAWQTTETYGPAASRALEEVRLEVLTPDTCEGALVDARTLSNPGSGYENETNIVLRGKSVGACRARVSYVHPVSKERLLSTLEMDVAKRVPRGNPDFDSQPLPEIEDSSCNLLRRSSKQP